MPTRVIGTGTDVTYSDLLQQLGEGEALYATWLRDPIMDSREGLVADEPEFDTIVAKTVYGYYVDLKFEARST